MVRDESLARTDMEWLTQNWIWLLVLAGVIFMMTRGGMGCHHMGRHGHPGQVSRDDDPRAPTITAPTTDPVSGEPVDPGSALSSAYLGRVYYFGSRENRDRFEQTPDRYATAASASTAETGGHRHHGHGC